MQFKDSFTVQADIATTWEFVSNIPTLLKCLPGSGEVKPLANGSYDTSMVQKVGPFGVSFAVHADVELTETETGRRIQARGRGRDAKLGSDMDFAINLALSPADGGTELCLDTQVNVRGMLAKLGYPVMQLKAKETFGQFAQNVRNSLEGR